jgi:hypothetical protein
MNSTVSSSLRSRFHLTWLACNWLLMVVVP